MSRDCDPRDGLHERLTRSGFGIMHADVSVAGSDDSPTGWLEKRSLLVRNLGSGFMVVLRGPRGTGKTQLACDLAAKILGTLGTRDTDNVGYYTFHSLMVTLKAAIDHGNQAKLIDLLGHHTRLLVIDELDIGLGTPYEMSLLSAIMDARYRRELDTVMITNMADADLIEWLPTSIMSRIGERGGFISCEWPVIRQPQDFLK